MHFREKKEPPLFHLTFLIVPLYNVQSIKKVQRKERRLCEMGKVDNNKQQKRNSLLDSAFSLFIHNGFNKTSISDIVDAVSYTHLDVYKRQTQDSVWIKSCYKNIMECFPNTLYIHS